MSKPWNTSATVKGHLSSLTVQQTALLDEGDYTEQGLRRLLMAAVERRKDAGGGAVGYDEENAETRLSRGQEPLPTTACEFGLLGRRAGGQGAEQRASIWMGAWWF